MKLLPLLALMGFLLALETAIPAWRNRAPVSTAPVFSLPLAGTAMKTPGDFQHVIEKYQANRGAELELPGVDDTSLTLFYFEWDQVEVGPIMGIQLHAPEVCNSSAGFVFRSRDASHVFQEFDHSPLVFDTTTFSYPVGRNVHVFKTVWVQGLGSWNIRSDSDRWTRLKISFARWHGVARVIECGVTGARDETQAWRIFRSEVLGKLKWSQNESLITDH